MGINHTSYNHLIDGDLAPIGRVHLVKMGDGVENENDHMLTEMDADANMGATKLALKSRKGPFKQSSGPSRVMDRSAHVVYRRRGLALEITARRGITLHEMETLIGKLGAHRFTAFNCVLYLLLGGSKKNMGKLSRVNMSKLEKVIEREINKRGTIGILVQDIKDRGSMHKEYFHGMKGKEEQRQMKRNFAA